MPNMCVERGWLKVDEWQNKLTFKCYLERISILTQFKSVMIGCRLVAVENSLICTIKFNRS